MSMGESERVLSVSLFNSAYNPWAIVPQIIHLG